MTGKLSLEALEVLDAIDRKGSFAAAAASLYRVPSALTYTIQKLEEDLGLVLFRKVGRKSELTPAGRHLVEQGRELLEAARRLEESTRQVNSGWEPYLKIALESAFEFHVLAPYLDRFYQLNSDVEISVVEEVLAGTWESLIDDEADLIVGVGEPDLSFNTQGICIQEFKKFAWHFLVPKGHPLGELKRPLTEDDVSQYRGVVVKDSSKHMPAFNRRVFEKQSALKVSSLSYKIEAQRQGLGVGFLPEHRVKDCLESGDLLSLEIEGGSNEFQSYIAWKSNNKGKALRWFVEALSEA